MSYFDALRNHAKKMNITLNENALQAMERFHQ